ncbi:MAG: SAM-dependent methyltransferase [Candidatus Thioglobus sp.]|uniref:class I SAM-dependent methyltransferase n=1 Tax=Candidatus Thioglobus sp. TaxID=2026721 RepID=UPI002602B813|nr:SAM-dependent methyltransferase [Candidatus Thioglobus sp.]MDC9726781.1 SAM-dependent methyltransferase [Candidatus Thioglobus sp.]
MNLEEIIKDTIIQNQAPIGFDEFMQLALYYPKLGYYRSGSEKFGEKGDFITAPETSDLFGFCLAKQCAEVLKLEDDILEFGAGSGVLAAQILFELGRLNKLPKHYYILELSAELRYRQQQTISSVLPELLGRVVWLDELPKGFCGVVIANEVLDAMPAKRIIQQKKHFYELGVGLSQTGFDWQIKNIKLSENDYALPSLMSEGYTTEINQQANAWINALHDAVDNALILLIDYGMHRDEYFHPQRNDGTLRCYHHHKASDNPFINIGEQDITTSVNFSDIADQASSSGFNIIGYATQAMFLLSLGIDEYLLNETDENKRITLAQQVKQLILPSAMGESFKVLALNTTQQVKLTGFKEQDLTHKL